VVGCELQLDAVGIETAFKDVDTRIVEQDVDYLPVQKFSDFGGGGTDARERGEVYLDARDFDSWV
jgi:hypothetical protein